MGEFSLLWKITWELMEELQISRQEAEDALKTYLPKIVANAIAKEIQDAKDKAKVRLEFSEQVSYPGDHS